MASERVQRLAVFVYKNGDSRWHHVRRGVLKGAAPARAFAAVGSAAAQAQ